MKQSIKRKWVKALRSGKYKQGTDCGLHEGNKYCCLGVLRELFPKSLRNQSQYDENGFLNSKQLGHCGLRRRTQESLADLNDSGVSFKDIANYIEKRLA